MKFGEVIIALMEDAKFYLRQIDENVYARPIRLLSNTSIGHQTQHIIEYLQCLTKQAPKGKIDYCDRPHQMELAQNPYYAIQIIDELITALVALDEEGAVSVSSVYNSSGLPSQPVASTIQRELLYNIEHIQYHFSLIKIGLSIEAPTIQLPSHFGKEPTPVKVA